LPGPLRWVLTVATGLGAPGGGCGVPPSAWCQNWVTALRCGALGHCPHLSQGPPDMDVCALCQQLLGFLRHISNQSSVEVPVGTGDRGHCGSVVGILCLHLPFMVTPCQALVQALVHRLLYECQHLMRWRRPHRRWSRQCWGAQPRRSVPIPGPQCPLPQGSGGAGQSPEALPMPVPLCWMCRKLVERAE
ncbi:PSPB protein, partial [Struthidea cinerea]|nr:PSPB protein [Struthidea cinerea]